MEKLLTTTHSNSARAPCEHLTTNPAHFHETSYSYALPAVHGQTAQREMHLVLALLSRLLFLYLGLLTSLGTMSLWAPTSGPSFLYRILLSYGVLVACAIYGVVASILLTLVGRRGIAQWATARAFKHSMRWTTGVRFRILGGSDRHLWDNRPAVFIGNHQTALDVLLLGTVFPRYCSVTSKKQLKRTPFLGWFMTLSGTVFIDRSDRQSAVKAFDGAAKEIRERRQSVFIFPEGTRSNAAEPTLLPFKKGAFHLAIQAKVPIVPVVAACYSGVLSVKEWRFRRGEIPVVGMWSFWRPQEFRELIVGIVLPPIPTDNLDASDVDQLTNYTRELMLKALMKLTESPQGQQAFKAKPGPLILPTKATEETAEVVEVEADNMDVKKDDPNALRKRVTEKELRENVGEEGMDGIAT